MQNCLRTCHVETVYVLWNYVLNDFKVFDEMLNLFSFKDFIAWYSSEKYTGQTQSIEHIV